MQLGVGPCSVPGCERTRMARELCPLHYNRWRRTGSTEKRKQEPPMERFMKKTKRLGGCLQWQGALDAYGYGIFWFEGKSVRAHRWAYIQKFGPVAEDRVMDHLCRNRWCVNPDHLEPAGNIENFRRGWGYRLQNGMTDRCIHGHEYTPENTYVRPSTGHWQCRTCIRARKRALREAAKERKLMGASD
jgi:hypothetical protein